MLCEPTRHESRDAGSHGTGQDDMAGEGTELSHEGVCRMKESNLSVCP
jgi:hypothetical protein